LVRRIEPAEEIKLTDASQATVPQEKRADLVLEGGGVKGVGLVGAVLTLHDAGYRFPRVAGTSAGAITAAIVAALQVAGKPLTLLEEYVNSIDYPRFQAEGWLQRALGRLGDAAQLLLHMGIHSGDYLVEWLGGVLEEIGITTFDQLRMDDPGSSLPEDLRYSLIVHTADITRRKVVRLPWDYSNYGLEPGRQRIVDAVRASMSIPFFFEPVRIKAPAATFGGVTYSKSSVMWVDGGLLSNFPVEVFDRSDGQPQRWPTIGIKLSARDTTIPPAQASDDTIHEAIDCLQTLLNNADRYYLTPDKVARTIFIDSTGITATDFDITPEQRSTLFQTGQQSAAQWLSQSATPPRG
jgi:NTE family protein